MHYYQTLDYQWYYNGIAIIGATNSTYSPDVLGEYTIKLTNNSSCYSSTNLVNINDVISSPEIIISQPNCVTNSGTITVASQASFYSFDNGLTWNTSNILRWFKPDTYYIKIKNSDNCISPATMATINAFTNYPETPSGVTPQFLRIRRCNNFKFDNYWTKYYLV